MNSGLDGTGEMSLEVFSTCPQSCDGDRETYVQRVADVAVRAEHHQFVGGRRRFRRLAQAEQAGVIEADVDCRQGQSRRQFPTSP